MKPSGIVMSESLRSSTEMLLLSADFKKFPANKPLENDSEVCEIYFVIGFTP